MKKITVSALLMVLVLISGCGSKKKITSISKGFDIEYEETKNDTKTEETAVTNTKTETVEVKDERVDIKTVIEYVFNDSGRVVKATKSIHDRSNVNTNRKETASTSDSTAKRVDSVTSGVKKSEAGLETNYTYIEPQKKRNPVWHWIGGALFLVIVGFAIWKIVLKR